MKGTTDDVLTQYYFTGLGLKICYTLLMISVKMKRKHTGRIKQEVYNLSWHEL
jgi:hypothetical protein